MNFGIIFLLVFAVFSKDGPNDNNNPDLAGPSDAYAISISIKDDTKVQEVTNTILYSIVVTNFTTLIEGPNNQMTPTVTQGTHVVYIPTILLYMKVVDALPTATPITITPVATQKLKSVVLNPGILIGCTFAIVFLIGVIYTSCCRRPQPIRRNVKRQTKQRKENSDDFEQAKRHRSKTRSANGSRHGSGSGKSRSSSGKSRSSSGHRGKSKSRTSSRV